MLLTADKRFVIRLPVLRKQIVGDIEQIIKMAISAKVGKSVVSDFILFVPRCNHIIAPKRIKFVKENGFIGEIKDNKPITYFFYTYKVRDLSNDVTDQSILDYLENFFHVVKKPQEIQELSLCRL